MNDNELWPPGSPVDLAERRRWLTNRGPFLSPSDAPPKCKPSGGDRTMISYRCVSVSCNGAVLAAELKTMLGSSGGEAKVSWASMADPRAYGFDRGWQPEDAWCPFCGEEGVTEAVESPAELLRRVAPELGT